MLFDCMILHLAFPVNVYGYLIMDLIKLYLVCIYQIADGMTLQVGVVNLLLETHGGARRRGGATW